MATLINGNGNNAVYAQQDADLYAGALGESTRILNVGSKLAYTIEDANTIAVADGVILTKEGRRIQVDVGSVDEFTIPTGAAGVTRYYIIGYHLYTDGSANQKCETFVQLMASESETIPEAEFREGATEVYVSLYRIKQIGLNLDTITALLSVGIALTDMTDVIGDTDISGIGDGTLTGGLNAVNQNLTEKIEQKSGSITADSESYTGINIDWITYDKLKKKMVLHEKGTGADAGIPFKSGIAIDILNWMRANNTSATLYYTNPDGETTTSTINTSSGTIVDDDFLTANIQYNSNGNYYIYITAKVPGILIAAQYFASGSSVGYVSRNHLSSEEIFYTTSTVFYHSTNLQTSGVIIFMPD